MVTGTHSNGLSRAAACAVLNFYGLVRSKG